MWVSSLFCLVLKIQVFAYCFGYSCSGFLFRYTSSSHVWFIFVFSFFLLCHHLNTFVLYLHILGRLFGVSLISKDCVFSRSAKSSFLLSMKIFILLLPFCSLAVLIPHKLIFISWHFKISLFSFPFPTETRMLAHGSWFLLVQRELLHPCDCQGCLAQGPAETFGWVLVACCTMTWLLFWSLWPGLLSPFLLCSKTWFFNLGTMDI